MKARVDLATMTGWNAEMFARTKRLEPLGTYLKPAQPPGPEQGAADLRAMIARMAAKQGARDGTG